MKSLHTVFFVLSILMSYSCIEQPEQPNFSARPPPDASAQALPVVHKPPTVLAKPTSPKEKPVEIHPLFGCEMFTFEETEMVSVVFLDKCWFFHIVIVSTHLSGDVKDAGEESAKIILNTIGPQEDLELLHYYEEERDGKKHPVAFFGISRGIKI